MLMSLSAQQYQALKLALEQGNWPDGRLLTAQQKSYCMEAVIHWEARNLEADQRTGHIDLGSKADGDACDEPAILRFNDT